ncbi:MAG: hypothetical protein CMI31_09680 [Opitutae bacterium]|nr:hypothetical protein [Opitutae bacterium]|tara:strand:+ start:610 stop:1209 length:600 start_codon:yes stop_codon:yes gene_type:complete
MKGMLQITALTILLPIYALAYETMYERTAVGEIEVKEIPHRVALETAIQKDYFAGDNNMFRTLFRYIRSNDLAMTVPVEAEMKPGKMRFFVGGKDAAKKITSRDGVAVREMQRITVVSIGIRGSYSKTRFQRYEQKLKVWLMENKEFEAISRPYGVYWNSPMVPGIFKRSEIHVVIRKKDSAGESKKKPEKRTDDPDES